MAERKLTEVLQNLYKQHDNAGVLQVLQSTAELIRRLWHENLFYPDLSTDDLIVAEKGQVSFHDSKKLVSRTCETNTQVEQLCHLNFLPDYMRVFLHMLWQEKDIPADFEQAFHQKWPECILEKNPSILQSWQNTWLWDENSAQAMVILKRKQKKQLRKQQSHLGTAWRLLSTVPTLFKAYKKTLRTAYQQPVLMKDKIGIALHPALDYQQPEMALLEELGNIPVLIRLQSHDSETIWQNSIDYIKGLTSKNIKVMVALLQDRHAVINSSHWHNFLQVVIPQLHDDVEWIEVGHAVNRVKWGVWTPKEYSDLFAISDAYKKEYPKLRLIGPAIIDFEWFRVIDFVKALPKKMKLFALSQHLYVDRRGAPENFQGKFSTLEKCAMGKALASTLKQTEDRFIISEFNWPLRNTGIYSPIGSPYTTPEWFVENPGVTEHEYAQYLIRYLTIAITSGFVTQAFCWRLSAHGYGLVDDLDSFRCRPAFYSLKFFIALLADATFDKKMITPKDVYCFEFKANTKTILLAWTSLDDRVPLKVSNKTVAVYDFMGGAIAMPENENIMLTGEVIYLVS
jgi:hypothetical protein